MMKKLRPVVVAVDETLFYRNDDGELIAMSDCLCDVLYFTECPVDEHRRGAVREHLAGYTPRTVLGRKAGAEYVQRKYQALTLYRLRNGKAASRVKNGHLQPVHETQNRASGVRETRRRRTER